VRGGLLLQFRGQGGLRGWGESGHAAAALDEGVHRQEAGAAAVGQDGEAVAVQGASLGQCLHGVEQGVDVVHPEHARAAKGGVVHVVRPEIRS